MGMRSECFTAAERIVPAACLPFSVGAGNNECPGRFQFPSANRSHPFRLINVSQLSAAGTQFVQTLAQRHGISMDAATHMLWAVSNGNGTMAQFNHPEFGGCGQWMQGGMTMVSDLFNNQLKSRVDSVCSDIASELARNQLVAFSGSFQSQSQNGASAQTQAAGAMGSANSLFVPDPTDNWWPAELGSPTAIGSQNNIRYAYFPHAQRLAVTTGGDAWVYDTGEHQIGGFSQQQGAGGSITFTSQFGIVNLSTLPLVNRGGVPQSPVIEEPIANPQMSETFSSSPVSQSAGHDDIIATLERLGALKEKGYLSEEEFASKKAELLSRL